MTDPDRAALTALVEKWRAEADAEETRLGEFGYGGPRDGEMLDEDITVAFVIARERKRCADELAGLLGRGDARRPANEEKENENR